MYIVSVLPYGGVTLSGKPATLFNQQDHPGTALVRFVFPLELVSEFDTWLDETLKPRHVERPTKVIEEYNDADGPWFGCEGLQVIYYAIVDEDQLEEVEKFAETYSDKRRD